MSIFRNYRKKPIVIQAYQWFPELGESPGVVDQAPEGFPPEYVCETLEGPLKVSPGDYIIEGVEGEYYPCKPSVFDVTYEEVP